MSKNPSIQPKTRIEKVKMAQLSCSFTTDCKTKCYFSRASQGVTAHTLNSWEYNIKENLTDVNVFQTRISSEKKLTLARIGLFGDYEGHDFTICLKYRAQVGV